MTRDLHVSGHVHADSAPDDWWRESVIYQIYPKSWADSNGDGVGDLNGIRARLGYLAELGVDAIWFSPFFVGPQKDGGYDVANYRDIDPLFGTLEDAELMIQEAHDLGIKILVDIVPNHSSNEHRFFKAALRTEPGSEEWSRYHCVKGKGDNGELPPNSWRSIFSGPAWTQIHWEGKPSGYWYLHLFDDSQPDVNWDNPDVVEEFDETLRFWFDRGVDGFRIDVAHGLIKADGYPESEGEERVHDEHGGLLDVIPMPYFDQPAVHDIYRRWRSIADEYTPKRIFVAEAWVPTAERLARYLRPDELHTGFNFGYLVAGWNAEAIRNNIEETLEFNTFINAPTTWVVENHDVVRSVTRYCSEREYHNNDGENNPDYVSPLTIAPTEAELELGRRRARAQMLLMLALPGTAYIWQGQELALEEVLDLEPSERQDPVFIRSRGKIIGRDGCRVPIPWTKSGTSFGFGPEDARSPWLTMPRHWGELSIEAQDLNPHSMLNLTRQALKLRRELGELGQGELKWRDDLGGTRNDVVAFERVNNSNSGVVSVSNLGQEVLEIPATTLLISSIPNTYVIDGQVDVQPDSTVWVLL
ncbi:MAG: glycoside hydrolase family 13 protein [Candidatus Nanopelagicales bacterium]